MNRILATALLMIATSSFFVFGKATTKKGDQQRKQSNTIVQELIRLDKEWNDAEVRVDIAALNRIVVDEFISVGERGEVETKGAVLEEFKSGDVKLESIAAEDYLVRVYGKTAVMIHRATLKGKYKDQDISNTYRATHVWVKRDGHWQVVSSQKTRIAER